MKVFITICLTVGIYFLSFVNATSVERVSFTGWTNKFTKENWNKAVDVGFGTTSDETEATQKCANYCAVNTWCGAFYLEDIDHLCYLVSNHLNNDGIMNSLNVEDLHGTGSGRYYFIRNNGDGLLGTVATDVDLL